jgi:hypothetical protein
VMRGPVLQISSVSLRPPLQRVVLSDSSDHIFLLQPEETSQTWVQRRRHDLDPGERRQRGNEAGLTSVQAGRGPPFSFWGHIVRESLFNPLINIGGLEKP